ncbi:MULTISPECIES: Nif11-like leader peptide family natural product precursor [Calothrix]|uniref:Nif11-like leader peptide family natural product n=2 Tax=Calothrix TaxID=1186 RepID=A0ABR8AFE6_9CYAN|nr:MULTISPECIES: Nif11-like leader peptide family natural product precursor [Calothrix]MBD2198633.1 Nif11-like leader peptide family natural product precursor [Calothrix parietina FACHB-288]MBD2227036.1 Nif11-like leader peptide family natural product precursor [Calothrix anomala FACHB-343]
MSLENVRAFYERLASDEAFRSQIQGIDSKEAGRELLQNSGLNFSQAEFEEYTEYLLETNAATDEDLKDLDANELEAVFGGAIPVIFPGILPILMYGVVISRIGLTF